MVRKSSKLAEALPVANAQVADVLERIGELLQRQAASQFRVAAYRFAGKAIRQLDRSLAETYARAGIRGLEKLPGVGSSIARKIADVLRTGHSAALARLEKKQTDQARLTSLPNVGPRLAERIHQALASDALEDVFTAAYDGRLQTVPGLGRKRLQAIRESLSLRLNRRPPKLAQTGTGLREPAIAELLAIDEKYRKQTRDGRLTTVAPRRFNPTGVAWLPILRAEKNGRQFTAHFSNTARAHQLGHLGDWVTIRCQDKAAGGPWVVVTGRQGNLKGRRVIRGREAQCLEHYLESKSVQLPLPCDPAVF